ncbi:MAG: DivIVA domain-containing protein [Candidatus Onthomonas sp.]
MLTPQAVAERTFTKAKFGGYTMQEVDDFLDEITKDYTSLCEENTSLRGKLKVLADKINEYRETEDIMRATLHNAQKTANEIVAEAESKREAILDALEQDIRARKQAYDDEIAVCRAQLASAREKTTEYIAMVQELTDQQQEFLSKLPDLSQGGDVEEPAEAPAEEVAAPEEAPALEQEGDTIGDMIAQEAEEAPQPEETPDPAPQPEEQPVEQQPFSSTSRIDFSNLKFGKDYEIK